MFKYVITAVFIFVAGVTAAQPVQANLGVGVGTGKIQVDETLRPGGIYSLPPISVFNTGDQSADYQMSVTFHEGQPELRPEADWIRFSPQEFRLEPGEAQAVEVELHLPIRLEPGDYFAYLEAGPLQVSERGESSIAVAAATKLNFTTEASSFWWAAYYKIAALWQRYFPWTYIGLGLASLALISIYMRGRFSLKPRRIKFEP